MSVENSGSEGYPDLDTTKTGCPVTVDGRHHIEWSIAVGLAEEDRRRHPTHWRGWCFACDQDFTREWGVR